MKKALFFGLSLFLSSSIFAQLPSFYRIDSTINAEIAQHNIAGGVALIAKNGTGKSTLLDLLAGKETQDNGIITLSNNVEVGYFEQIPNLISNS